jgi:lysophospholipase L1-like esterase
MKRNLLLVLPAIGVIAALIVARNFTIGRSSSPDHPPESVVANPAIEARPQDEDWWRTRHQAIISRIMEGDADLIFLGDSIFQNFEKNRPPNQIYSPIWTEFYGDRHAVNMSFSGDQTGNLLWRLENGEILGIHPKVAVILIGTNNTALSNQTARQTRAGIEAVVDTVLIKLPATKILLLGILPSDIASQPGKFATDEQVNAMLAADYAGRDDVIFLNVSTVFMKNNKVDWSLYIDPDLPQADGKIGGPLHPNPQGQRLLAEAIEPTLAKLMRDENKLGKPKPGSVPSGGVPSP